MSSELKKVFNIYYINFSKVYEISMMINNVILSSIQRENSSSSENTNSVSANSSISTALDNLASIKSYMGTQLTEKQTNSSKMVESLDVKTTKSILLKQIDKRSKVIEDFTACSEGDLVKVDNVKLRILNEENLRELKIFRSNALKDFRVEGVDVNNLITSMLKDYSYLLYGQMPNSSEMIVIKIPMELENEFESNYNIDDITIGRVSIIGVYKGIVEEEKINTNTFNYLYDIGLKQQSQKDDRQEEKVISSAYQDKPNQPGQSNQNRSFVFIDVIAIIQNVNFSEEKEEQARRNPWYKKILNWFKKKGE
ncbi:hypothetical protein [Allobacillus halotolerans]|uniref:Uncharacterized protein n=1 Tax=Allobacillus halotolerans TaxID=570278 RepID=A0ABS6GLL8_9BACI|nr:hypothetical protein [Allobacillus halotolerans]MBU6080026.1 hypothetical protein [Allobacillus halotolerans]